VKIECPVCKGTLIHEHSRDGVAIHEIDSDGKVIDFKDHDNSGGTVYCKTNSDHEIPNELLNKVLDCVGRFEAEDGNS